MPTPKPPPTTTEIVRTIRVTTPPEYHEPILDTLNETGQIYQGNARTLAELAKTISRGATRQFFVVPPGFEPAGPGTRATMTVQLERTQSLDEGLVFEPGGIVLEGPRGRFYRNVELVSWLPNDVDPLRSVVLVCDLIGEPGNLDFLADADGNLTEPGTSNPGTDVVDYVDLSQGRSGIRGVLTVSGDALSELTDDGAAPTFSPRDPDGMYLRIDYAGNVANIGRVVRVVGYGQSTVEDPPGSNLFPRTVTLGDGVLPNYLSSAQLDDGGAFTDQTAESRSTAADDITLLPAVPVVNDAAYFGASEIFDSISIEVTTPRIGDLTLVWEVWNGAIWAAVSVDDNTDGFTVEGVNTVVGGAALMTATTVNGIEAFYIRARVTAFVSQFQQPLGARVLAFYGTQLLADPLDAQGFGQITWTLLDAQDLGVKILEMTAAAGGRDNDLGLKIDERSVTPRQGESLDALRRRASRFANSVSPTLIEREINQILEPFGLAGLILDIGDGFSGLFWDLPTSFAPDIVSAWDLYGPGDLFPVDQTFLPLAPEELRWHFYVCVPPATLGEFGAAWDQGPPSLFVDQYGGYVGSAWDYAFGDGYPWLSSELYKQVYEKVAAIKGGGIDFTMLQCDVPTCA